MLLYYLSLAFRNLNAKGGFYAINISGLAIGLAAMLLISHYVRFHRSFDAFRPDSERIYRVIYSRWSDEGKDLVAFASATPIIGRAMRENFPEVELQGQAFRQEGIFSYHDLHFEETRSFFAENDLIHLMGTRIIEGEKDHILDLPGKMAISRSTALKYFGNEPPVGKVIYYNYNTPYEVVAVFEDCPPNTHFRADLLLSMEDWKRQNPEIFLQGYIYSGFYNYVKLRQGADPKEVDRKLASYVAEEYGGALAEGRINMGFKLQPLRDIHLHSNLMHELEKNGDITSIQLLEIVAWFILVIAWVNFFNLSTITSMRRTREINIRKVNGATRWQLIVQLLTESALVNFIAIMFALFIFEISAPWFINFAGLPQKTMVWDQSWVYATLLIALIAGIASSGVYATTGIPLTRLTEGLKGAVHGVNGRKTIRRLLVTLQFVIAIGLIAATTAIFSQYRLLSSTPLGFNPAKKLVVSSPLVTDTISLNRLNILKHELASVKGFNGASFSSIIPGKPNIYNRGGVYLQGQHPASGKNYRVAETDEKFFDLLEIKMLAGEGFTGNQAIDRNKVLLNKAGALWMGFNKPEDAVGRKIVLEREEYTITGITDDFHQMSPSQPIEPHIFRSPRRYRGFITIDIGSTPAAKAIAATRRAYDGIFPASPFSYLFLKEFYDNQHLGEKRFGTVFLLFSLLVIIITILGLMGLSAYTAAQKRKEIAIRKVLGASPFQIFSLMFREYIVLWAISAVIALPVAWYFINNWLAGFAIRIEPGYSFYFLPLFIVLLVSITTVFMLSQRVLRLNPSETTRTD